jgi:enamine deaminase RidA (YjgF/YER057c/UK114 family)
LHFRRLPLTEAASAAPMLGARLLVPAASGAEVAAGLPVGPVHAELLQPAAATLDVWFGGAVTTHALGAVRFCTDGHWLHGSAELAPETVEGGLEQAAYRLYTDLFATLDRHAGAHLLRLWNYVPGINDMGDGLEHYRHFNIGRQQAFIDAGRSAFEGSPAACALGVQGGPLRVFFLAGPAAPLAIENPRQVSAYRYPDQYGPRSPTFSRAALAPIGGGRQALFISGTASIRGHASLHAGDVRRQTDETLVNISALLEATQQQAGARLTVDALVWTVYLRRRADLPVVRELLERHLGLHSEAARSAVYLLADICRSELLVEIEAHGFVAAEGDA